MRQPLDRRTVARSLGIAFAFAAITGCSRSNRPDDELGFEHEPIAVHVRNENFLDMNVAVLSGGVARRLGQVTGNGSADFKIAWSVAIGQQIALTATPIGGRGTFTTAGLSVGSGQMVDFHIGSVLRQSTAVVQEPPL